MPRTTAGTRTTASGTNLSNCLSFDGTSSYVNIPDNAAYSQPTTGALTISVWMNPSVNTFTTEEGTGYVHWLSKLDSNQNEWTFRMYGMDNTEARDNRISFYLFAAAGGLGEGVAFQDTIIPGEWIHLVATVDANKVMTLYKNGVKRDVATSTLTLTDGTAPVRIGTGAGANQSFFQGQIDDVRIYNRVLTQDEITTIYRANNPITSGMVGWWKLDEGSGTTATDSSTTANNGTITSSSYVSSLARVRLPISPFTKYMSSTLNAVNISPRKKLVRSFGTHSLNFPGVTSFATNTYTIPTNMFSLAFWFRPQRFTANDRIVDVQVAGPADGFTILISSANIVNATIRNVGTNVASLSTLDSVAFGEWNHLVLTYEVNSVKLYLNGVYQATDTSATMTASTAVFTLGRRSPTASNYFKGDIDEFLFYNAVLTQDEINNLYFNGAVPATQALYYTFDNVATDSSGNGNDLTLTATTYITSTPMITRTAVT